MLYLTNSLAYKPRLDLDIYKTKEPESTLIELTHSKKQCFDWFYLQAS